MTEVMNAVASLKYKHKRSAVNHFKNKEVTRLLSARKAIQGRGVHSNAELGAAEVSKDTPVGRHGVKSSDSVSINTSMHPSQHPHIH